MCMQVPGRVWLSRAEQSRPQKTLTEERGGEGGRPAISRRKQTGSRRQRAGGAARAAGSSAQSRWPVSGLCGPHTLCCGRSPLTPQPARSRRLHGGASRLHFRKAALPPTNKAQTRPAGGLCQPWCGTGRSRRTPGRLREVPLATAAARQSKGRLEIFRDKSKMNPKPGISDSSKAAQT